MKLNMKPVNNWFGFTRRERVSSLILLLLIVVVLLLRYIVPHKDVGIEDYSAFYSRADNLSGSNQESIVFSEEQFIFDPNTASYDTLILLGLESREARTLINYRNKGGRFREPSDIKRVYGLDDKKAEYLIAMAEIKKASPSFQDYDASKQLRTSIDINRCDSSDLESLPGIGPVLSARIIKFRNLLGGFAKIEQLKEVYGLPEETYNTIRDRIVVDTAIIRMISINSADYRELSRLIYLTPYDVTAIMKYRELTGPVRSISDLVENRILKVDLAAKVRPYLNFE